MALSTSQPPPRKTKSWVNQTPRARLSTCTGETSRKARNTARVAATATPSGSNGLDGGRGWG
ncbi:hypothetical protein ACN28S_17825 [Cystobacter fuscus]